MHTYFRYSPKENSPLTKKKKSSEGLKVTGIHKDKEKMTEDKFYQQQFGSWTSRWAKANCRES